MSVRGITKNVFYKSEINEKVNNYALAEKQNNWIQFIKILFHLIGNRHLQIWEENNRFNTKKLGKRFHWSQFILKLKKKTQIIKLNYWFLLLIDIRLLCLLDKRVQGSTLRLFAKHLWSQQYMEMLHQVKNFLRHIFLSSRIFCINWNANSIWLANDKWSEYLHWHNCQYWTNNGILQNAVFTIMNKFSSHNPWR